MADIDPIDISDMPLLQRLVEEVNRKRKPVELRRGDVVVARLMPAEQTEAWTTKKRTPEGHTAFLESAGSWADVDVDEFVNNVYESRRISTKRPVDL